jgi:hypothetical protein
MSIPDTDSSNNNLVFKSVLVINDDVKEKVPLYDYKDQTDNVEEQKWSENEEDSKEINTEEQWSEEDEEDIKEIITEEQWSVDDYVDKTSEEIALENILDPIKNKYQNEHQQNLKSYRGRFWIYLCYIGNFKFKYGKTKNPFGRFSIHSKSFRYFEPLFLAECSNYTVSEGEFREYIKELKINTNHIDNNYHTQLEIFQIKLNFTADYLNDIFKKFLKIAKDNYKLKIQEDLKKKCKYCGKIFYRNCDLKRHEQTTKSCYMFSVQNNIDREIISFNCTGCEKSFTSKVALNKHLTLCSKIRDKEYTANEEKLIEERQTLEELFLKEKEKLIEERQSLEELFLKEKEKLIEERQSLEELFLKEKEKLIEERQSLEELFLKEKEKLIKDNHSLRAQIDLNQKKYQNEIEEQNNLIVSYKVKISHLTAKTEMLEKICHEEKETNAKLLEKFLYIVYK